MGEGLSRSKGGKGQKEKKKKLIYCLYGFCLFSLVYCLNSSSFLPPFLLKKEKEGKIYIIYIGFYKKKK